jgi:Leucine-rich repeat (LRR) protein
MNSSILKDYKDHISKSDISREINNSNSASIPQEKSEKIIIIINETCKINLSYNEPSKYKIICKNCNNFPRISFNNDYTLNLLCDCKSKKNIDFDFFIKNYIIKDDINLESQIKSKIFIENYCFCDTHAKYYTYICETCTKNFNKISGMNLCEDCIKNNSSHSHHDTIYRNDKNIYSKINKIVEFIKNQKEIIQSSDDNCKKFLCIIQLILICYKYYFCYNIYQTLNLMHDFITIEEINRINNNENSIKQKELINVKEKREIICLYDKKYHEKIKSIEIIKCNFYNINILADSNFLNLEVLSLSNDNIINIKPLLSMKAPNLKKLNLSSNKITDDYIDIIKDLNFPELNFLSLSRNYFHKYKIFNCFKNHEKLSTLYLGSNKFEDIINNNNIIQYDLSTIKVLGLSQGVFSNNTIKLISTIKLDNLEDIYIYGNNLNSLSFVENIECPKLKLFYAQSNNIKDFWPLKKFNNLNKINLNNNPIKSTISELIKFLKNFEKLQQLKLANTKIEGDKEKFKNIFIRINIEI